MYDKVEPQAGAAQPDQQNEQLIGELSLHPGEWALFFDIDGTLIDLADTPDAITVPHGLPGNLDRLSQLFGGAVALVTGRPVALADDLFFPFRFPIAGLHGAERRGTLGRMQRLAPSPAFEAMKKSLSAEAKALRGVLIEDKGAAVAAHFRLAPQHEADATRMMERHIAQAGPNWTLQRGKMVVEIRPAGADKGQAIEAFLDEAPFRGRRPLAIGDDVTDEAMFHSVNRLGGQSLRIGAPGHETLARGLISSPSVLRGIIQRLVA